MDTGQTSDQKIVCRFTGFYLEHFLGILLDEDGKMLRFWIMGNMMKDRDDNFYELLALVMNLIWEINPRMVEMIIMILSCIGDYKGCQMQ
ncbi:hypothetical protein HPP92_024811 [Vanilla planifolia]|uniref:Uncharacterized protein n=1 Tax=Vanilla planifolia TaxID=51239 RepID=A0A835PNS4_VANPL|nr:hypothetical protein HPP92_024811 [Vanilla planifolia]